MKKFISLISVLLLTGCINSSEKFTDFISMSPDDFISCATIKNEPLDQHITISTFNCFKDNKTFDKRNDGNDIYLFSNINKETNRKSYFVNILLRSKDWRTTKSLNYMLGDLKSRSSHLIDSDVICYSSSCVITELYSFNIPESDILQIINDPNLLWWNVRVKNFRLGDIDWQIHKNELKALYEITQNF